MGALGARVKSGALKPEPKRTFCSAASGANAGETPALPSWIIPPPSAICFP